MSSSSTQRPSTLGWNWRSDALASVSEIGRKASPLAGNWLEPLAELYVSGKQPEKALPVLRELIEADADDVEGRLKLFGLLAELGKWDEAEAVARDALCIDPLDPRVRDALLKAFGERKKEAEVERYRKLFAEQPPREKKDDE